jgi:hypothetical protein
MIRSTQRLLCKLLFCGFIFELFWRLSVIADSRVLNVDYQIHSNNDLKELPQTLLKGARRFKFDPHYVRTSAQCGENKACLLLNHDQPVENLSQYNTSTELLSFLNSAEFALLSNNEYVTVALCFKSAPDLCQNSTEFNSWLALVDQFYLEALQLPPQIEFILDGDAKPINCLVGRWSKWNSVWIQSPSDAFYSNGEEEDNFRFQVLNNPESMENWTWLASPDVNYGKFSSSKYPYQLWEVRSYAFLPFILIKILVFASGSLCSNLFAFPFFVCSCVKTSARQSI